MIGNLQCSDCAIILNLGSTKDRLNETSIIKWCSKHNSCPCCDATVETTRYAITTINNEAINVTIHCGVNKHIRAFSTEKFVHMDTILVDRNNLVIVLMMHNLDRMFITTRGSIDISNHAPPKFYDQMEYVFKTGEARRSAIEQTKDRVLSKIINNTRPKEVIPTTPGENPRGGLLTRTFDGKPIVNKAQLDRLSSSVVGIGVRSDPKYLVSRPTVEKDVKVGNGAPTPIADRERAIAARLARFDSQKPPAE
jgi:hypothetical protein